MKFTSIVLFLMCVSSAQAAVLRCESQPKAGLGGLNMPKFSMQALVNDGVLYGQELSYLVNLQGVVVGKTEVFGNQAKDASYKPRGVHKDVNRFLFSANATTSTPGQEFDGIIHGAILPRHLAAGTKRFVGQLTFSTDSYHDGIISYGRMECSIQ